MTGQEQRPGRAFRSVIAELTSQGTLCILLVGEQRKSVIRSGFAMTNDITARRLPRPLT